MGLGWLEALARLDGRGEEGSPQRGVCEHEAVAGDEGLEKRRGRGVLQQRRLAPALEQPPEGGVVEERVVRLVRQPALQRIGLGLGVGLGF